MKRPTQVSVEVAPDPDQVFQLWKKTLSKQHTAKVTVTEKAPDADQSSSYWKRSQHVALRSSGH